MKPNIAQRHARAGGRAGAARRSTAASTSSAWPSRPSRATAPPATRSSCSSRASPTSRMPRRSSASTALLELKLVEAGPAPSREALLQATTVRSGRHGGRSGRRRRRATRADPFYLVQEGRRGDRPRPAQREAVARREQPAGGELLADGRRVAQVRQGDGREHRPVAGDRARQARAVGAADRRPDHRPGHDLRLLHDRGGAGPVADAAIRRAAGVARPTSRSGSSGRALGADSIRAGVMASVAGLVLDRRLHADLLQAVRRQRRDRAA